MWSLEYRNDEGQLVFNWKPPGKTWLRVNEAKRVASDAAWSLMELSKKQIAEQMQAEKVNPEIGIDKLPQPYRMIDKVMETVLERFGQQIDEICRLQKLEEYEHSLTIRPPEELLH